MLLFITWSFFFSSLLMYLIRRYSIATCRGVAISLSLLLLYAVMYLIKLYVDYIEINGISFFQYSSIPLLKSSSFFGSDLNYIVCVDGISLLMILLISYLLVICIFTAWNVDRFSDIVSLLFLVCFASINVFILYDLLLFYIFFELVVLPMMLIIGIWGSRQEQRIVAAFKFAMYTIFGSFFLLFSLLYIVKWYGTLNYFELVKIDFTYTEQLFLWLAFFIAFAVKVPLFPLHTWLPDAHSEAPTVGSIILAGILLKLGPYGLIRFNNVLFLEGLYYFRPLIYFLCIVGLYYTSLIALRQIDLKKIIAYSSIGHMAFVVLGLTVLTPEGLYGSVTLMIAHGFVSSGLFLLIGLMYDRYKTRLIPYYGGLIQINPILGVFMFIFLLGNIGFPGTINFVSELSIVLSLYDLNSYVIILILIGTIFVLSFNLWFYSRIFFGQFSFIINFNNDLDIRERMISFFLVYPVFIGGLLPVFLKNVLDLSISNNLFLTFFQV